MTHHLSDITDSPNFFTSVPESLILRSGDTCNRSLVGFHIVRGVNHNCPSILLDAIIYSCSSCGCCISNSILILVSQQAKVLMMPGNTAVVSQKLVLYQII